MVKKKKTRYHMSKCRFINSLDKFIRMFITYHLSDLNIFRPIYIIKHSCHFTVTIVMYEASPRIIRVFFFFDALCVCIYVYCVLYTEQF